VLESPPLTITSRQAKGIGEWNEIVLEAFSGTSVDSFEPEFPAGLSRCSIDELKFTCVVSQPSRVHRWNRLHPSKMTGVALLHLQDFGVGTNFQCGRVAQLVPGSGALCDPDQHYMIDFATPYRMFIVELPLPRIAVRAPLFDLPTQAGTSVEIPKSKMLLSILRTAWEEFDHFGNDEDWCRCMSSAALELALGAICKTNKEHAVRPNVDLRRAVIEYIRVNIEDPDLRILQIATAFSVDRRTIQFVFERMSTTASAFILNERLMLAADRLRNGRGRSSMTEIAYSSGFSDSAYFSRCFRKKFGMPPSQFW
jgi:AraC-like DNA-binding protein